MFAGWLSLPLPTTMCRLSIPGIDDSSREMASMTSCVSRTCANALSFSALTVLRRASSRARESARDVALGAACCLTPTPRPFDFQLSNLLQALVAATTAIVVVSATRRPIVG